jgi:hypothetical protein
MLLSMYVSYQLANRNKIIYVLSMVVFVLLISFLSVILPLDQIGVYLFFPFLCWSFPFYSYIESVNLGDPGWVDFYKIRFLTVDLTSALPFRSGMHALDTVIPVFLLVNVVGALLGFGLSRITRIREWGNNRTWKLAGLILGAAFLMIGWWLIASNSRIVVNGRIVRPEGLYYMDGAAVFLFGIIVLLIAVGKILWGLKIDFWKNSLKT